MAGGCCGESKDPIEAEALFGPEHDLEGRLSEPRSFSTNGGLSEGLVDLR